MVWPSGLHLDDQLPDQLQAIAQNTLVSGENFLPDSFNEVITYRINDEDKFFLPRVLAMRNKEDALFGVAVVLYDVTRFRLLDATKTDLVATVSHEIKKSADQRADGAAPFARKNLRGAHAKSRTNCSRRPGATRNGCCGF